jgi:hypothetical protein
VTTSFLKSSAAHSSSDIFGDFIVTRFHARRLAEAIVDDN